MQCASAGNATVVVGVSLSSCPACLPAQQFVNTNSEPRSVTVGAYVFRLDSLLPATRTTHVVAPNEYVTYFTVTTLPDR